MSADASMAGPGHPATALVSGGAGFVGSHLVDQLVAGGTSVRVLDDLSSGHLHNLEDSLPSIELIRADLLDAAALERATRGVDVIFHLAAIPSVPISVREPARTNQVNLQGTLSILEAARKHRVGRVVFASSCAIYGDAPTLPKLEDLPPRPLSPYALQKLGAELYCKLYADLYGLETVSLRYFNIYGPRQDPASDYAAVIPLFISAALRGDPLRIFGEGDQTRDFVYVGDVVEANLRAATAAGVAGAVLNVASGRRTSIGELAQLIGECVDRELVIQHAAPRKGDILHSWADVSRARELLDYNPSVDLKEGLRLTIEATPLGLKSP